MEKIPINRKWMDGISMTLALIVIAFIAYFFDNHIPDEHAQLGSVVALLCILLFVPVGRTIDKFMRLFLDDGRKNPY